MIKIVIINHTFQRKDFYWRWQSLSKKYKDIDITLIAPEKWEDGKSKGLTFGCVKEYKGVIINEDHFRIIPVNLIIGKHGDWTYEGIEKILIKIVPDVIYHIGTQSQDALFQILKLKNNKVFKKTKFIAFSMRGPQLSLRLEHSSSFFRQLKLYGKYLFFAYRLFVFNRKCDAVFCHYPRAVQEFRREGYKGPIYMQTQVGVNPDIFHPDASVRNMIREKLGIGNCFLFGTACRFNRDKGLLEIIDALPENGNWKYLIMGWGNEDEVKAVKNKISEKKLEDKVILAGFIDGWNIMAEYWNAVDCAIHAPLTSNNWEETFSLALVQAMATGKPIIGSSSGSVPYQIGCDEMIVPEGNIDSLRFKMIEMMTNESKCNLIGEKMLYRANKCFSIYHLNDLFYLTIKDICAGRYDEKKTDMTLYMENVDG